MSGTSRIHARTALNRGASLYEHRPPALAHSLRGQAGLRLLPVQGMGVDRRTHQEVHLPRQRRRAGSGSACLGGLEARRGSAPYRGRFLGKPLGSFSRFGLQDVQPPPSPRVGEGGRGMRGKRRANAANRALLLITLPLRALIGLRAPTRTPATQILRNWLQIVTKSYHSCTSSVLSWQVQY